jgi:hypothetical protein
VAKGRLKARRPHTVIDLRQESLSADVWDTGREIR